MHKQQLTTTNNIKKNNPKDSSNVKIPKEVVTLDIKVEFRFRLRPENAEKFVSEYIRYLDSNDLIDMGKRKYQEQDYILLKTALLPISDFNKIKDHLALLTEKYTVTTTMEMTNLAEFHRSLNQLVGESNNNKEEVKENVGNESKQQPRSRRSISNSKRRNTKNGTKSDISA